MNSLMRLYKTLLAAAAFGAAFILPGESLPKKPEAPTAQSRLEQILNSDWIEETLIQDKFEPLTEADKATLNCLIMHCNQYYNQVDDIIKQRKVKYDEPLFAQALSSVSQYISANNKELNDFLLQRYNNKTELQGDVFIRALDEYFKKKGRIILYATIPEEYGLVPSCIISEIQKVVQVNGRIWEHPISKTASYAKRILGDYTATRNNTSIRTGEYQNDEVYIYLDEWDLAFSRQLEDLKKFRGEVRDDLDLFGSLLKNGLQEYLRNPDKIKMVKRATERMIIHEMAHLVGDKIYGTPDPNDIKSIVKSEVFAILTEIKNGKDEMATYALASTFATSALVYKKASTEVVSLFLSEMYNEKERYPNINFEDFDINRQNTEALYLQLHKLSPNQIRELAAKSFMRRYPEASKAYNPAGK